MEIFSVEFYAPFGHIGFRVLKAIIASFGPKKPLLFLQCGLRCVCVCVRASVSLCVRTCMRVCVHVCVRVFVYASVLASVGMKSQ